MAPLLSSRLGCVAILGLLALACASGTATAPTVADAGQPPPSESDFVFDPDVVRTYSITMTADREDNLPGFCEELSTLGEVQVEKNHALVCVVGQGMAKQLGIPAQVLGTLADVGVRVRVISQGAIKVNIGLVIDQSDLTKAVRALHARFF